jgi:hypothetical protein
MRQVVVFDFLPGMLNNFAGSGGATARRRVSLTNWMLPDQMPGAVAYPSSTWWLTCVPPPTIMHRVCRGGIDYSRSFEFKTDLELAAIALIAASGLFTLVFTVTLFTGKDATRPPRSALAVFPALVAVLVAWALVPVRAETPTVELPTTFQVTFEHPREDTEVFTVDDGQVAPTEYRGFEAGLASVSPLFSDDGNLSACSDYYGRSRPALAAYTWSRHGDVLVGTVTAESLRAGTVACDGSISSRLATRYDPVRYFAVGERVTIFVADDLRHRITRNAVRIAIDHDG